MSIKIAIQGIEGSFSHLASLKIYPDAELKFCPTFEEAFQLATKDSKINLLMPIENTIAGRVADLHSLLPKYKLQIYSEHFQKISHNLLGVKGAKLGDLSYVHSHVHALNQCRKFIKRQGITPVVHVDTAAAARDIAERGDKSHGAIATKLAGETYGLESLEDNIEDADHNTTRFLLMAPEPAQVYPDNTDVMTSFIFRVRNVPAALYKSLGGFATNGVNITKLESYLIDGGFVAAQFYAEVEGHPENHAVNLALEELNFFSTEVRILGTYPADPFRKSINDD